MRSFIYDGVILCVCVHTHVKTYTSLLSVVRNALVFTILKYQWKGISWEAPNQTSQWRRWTRRLGAEGNVFRWSVSKMESWWQSAAGRWIWFQIVLWTRDFVHWQGRASGERGQYRQWQGEVKEKTLLKPNVFRSTPAKIRGTIVFGTREHRDRNRDCQRSLRASWRKQQEQTLVPSPLEEL